MHYIKEIFLDRPVDYVHAWFTRYGKGTFAGPALSIKHGTGIKADGSIHYVNILGELIAKNSQQDYKADGTINVKREIKIPVEARKKPAKGGLHIVEVNDTVNSDALKMIYGDYKDAYILLELSPSSGRWKLKTKKKLPKPGGGLNDKFCSATLESNALDGLMDEVLFDVKDRNFKEATVKHDMIIEELVGSPELKKDAVRFRLEAKRKGKIKRTVTVDGRKTESIHEFII